MNQAERSGTPRANLRQSAGSRKEVHKTDLSAPRRRLLELMQEVNFGRIEGLQVRDGEPVFDLSPRVKRLYLFGRENEPHESRGCEDFALRKKVAELFEVFDRERSLFIQELMIESGLPVRMIVMDADRIQD